MTFSEQHFTVQQSFQQKIKINREGQLKVIQLLTQNRQDYLKLEEGRMETCPRIAAGFHNSKEKKKAE